MRISLLFLVLVACAKQELVHDLDERDANEIYVLLNSKNISAQKVPDLTSGGGGNKGPKFMIVVPGSEAQEATKHLQDNQLPRRKDQGWQEVFSSAGLIPTASEEKAKTMQAITGELSRTLKSIDGVLDARVHVVLPEESVLRVKEEDKADVTAGVWYKYVPRGKNSQPPLTVQEVQDLVAASVEKLKPERVKVIATPVLGMVSAGADPAAPDAAAGGEPLEKIMGLTMRRADVSRFKLMVGGAIVLIVIVTIGFMAALMKKAGHNVAPPRGMMRPPSDGPPAA